jgi:hypothetical protein
VANAPPPKESRDVAGAYEDEASKGVEALTLSVGPEHTCGVESGREPVFAKRDAMILGRMHRARVQRRQEVRRCLRGGRPEFLECARQRPPHNRQGATARHHARTLFVVARHRRLYRPDALCSPNPRQRTGWALCPCALPLKDRVAAVLRHSLYWRSRRTRHNSPLGVQRSRPIEVHCHPYVLEDAGGERLLSISPPRGIG